MMTVQILIITVLRMKDAISFITDFCRKIMRILDSDMIFIDEGVLETHIDMTHV